MTEERELKVIEKRLSMAKEMTEKCEEIEGILDRFADLSFTILPDGRIAINDPPFQNVDLSALRKGAKGTQYRMNKYNNLGRQVRNLICAGILKDHEFVVEALERFEV